MTGTTDRVGRSGRPTLWCLSAFAAVAVSASAVLMTASPAGADAVRAAQWHLRTLDVARAHDVTGGDGVTVAVIDSGVDASHPDLRDNVVPGKDFVAGTDGRVDRNGHGTGVAALIAAHGHGTGDGVLGVAPGATILPVRVSDASGHYRAGHAARAIRWAADHGAGVVNLSGGSPSDTPALRGAVAYAQSLDVVVVASVGNADQGDRRVLYPAAYPGVIAVASVDSEGEAAPGSVHGPQVSLAAPGVQVVSAGTGHGYAVGVGTSDAAALVSGAAALVRAGHPGLDAAGVVARLVRTADDRGEPGRDPRYGFGVLDPVAALTADVAPPAGNPLGSVAVRDGLAPRAAGARNGRPSWAYGLFPAVVVGGCSVVLAALSLGVGWRLTVGRRRRLAPPSFR